MHNSIKFMLRKQNKNPITQDLTQSPVKNSPSNLGRWLYISKVCSLTLTLLEELDPHPLLPGFRVPSDPEVHLSDWSPKWPPSCPPSHSAWLWSVWATWTGAWKPTASSRRRDSMSGLLAWDPVWHFQDWRPTSLWSMITLPHVSRCARTFSSKARYTIIAMGCYGCWEEIRE